MSHITREKSGQRVETEPIHFMFRFPACPEKQKPKNKNAALQVILQGSNYLPGNCKTVKGTSVFPALLINPAALVILRKFLFGCVHVAVYLPATAALAAAGLVFNESGHILWRISQKEPDFVREGCTAAQFPGKLGNTVFTGTGTVVSVFL